MKDESIYKFMCVLLHKFYHNKHNVYVCIVTYPFINFITNKHVYVCTVTYHKFYHNKHNVYVCMLQYYII